jgi:phage terminase large subunit GpA-like protein
MDVPAFVQLAFKEFKPPERIKVSDWAQKYYRLPETSAEPGCWVPSRAPYQSGIMDAINEPGIQKVSIMCCAQVGKTIILLAIICYLIDLDPCSILMTFPAANDAEIFSKEKLASAIVNVEPVANKIKLKARNSSSTILMKMFPGGFLRLTGANSPSSLASMSIRVYLGDEIDKYPASAGKEGDPIKLAIERTATFWNWLVLLVSTPSNKGTSRIDDQFQESDRRYFFVACPYCGHHQHLVWSQIEYAGKDTVDADPVSGVYYICEKCDRPIEERYKTKMLSAGEWRATAKAKNPKHAGFHLNRLCSPWANWVDLALDYESSRLNPQTLQVFTNAILGLPFENSLGEKLDWEKLRDRADQSGYQQGVVPDGGLILTAGVDVQADRLEVVVVAWGRGEEAFVVAYEKILGDPLQGEVWEQLVQITSREYPIQKVVGSREKVVGSSLPTTHYLLPPTLRIRATCVDSGFLTQEVYCQVKKYRSLHWFAIKGVSGDKPLVSSPSIQEINYKGQKIKRGINLYRVGVDVAKETLYGRSQIESPGQKYLNFPSDLDSDWYKGFCSEVQVTEHKNGRPYLVWQKLAGVRNEPLDTFVYALAAANLVGISRINWNSIEQQLKTQESTAKSEQSFNAASLGTRNRTRTRTKKSTKAEG